MVEVFLLIVSCIFSYMLGHETANSELQDKCVAKYAEMPHNKVGDFCKDLLKFTPETTK